MTWASPELSAYDKSLRGRLEHVQSGQSVATSGSPGTRTPPPPAPHTHATQSNGWTSNRNGFPPQNANKYAHPEVPTGLPSEP